MAAHADTDDADLGDVGVFQHLGMTQLILDRGQSGARARQVGLAQREGHVGRAVGRDVLHDHVDIDVVVGEPAENRGRDPRPVRDAAQGDLGLIAGVRDAGDNFFFHDLVLIHHQRAGQVLAQYIGIVLKAAEHLNAHAFVHRQFDTAGLQHFRTDRGQLQHFLIGDLPQFAGFRHDPRVRRIDAIDIGIDVAAIRLQRRRQRHGRGIRPAAAECRDPIVRGQTLKARDDGDLPLVHALDQLGPVDPIDAGLAVRGVGVNGDLPALP